jgi:hypothetical protein
MTLIWLIAWLAAAWIGDRAPVGDAWTGTLIIAFSIDIAIRHTLRIGTLSTEETRELPREIRSR